MINTLIKIGNVIKNDKDGCIKQHPLIKDIYLNSTDKKKKDFKDYIVFKVDINTSDKTLKIHENDIPFYDFKNVLKFDTGGNNNPYIFGDFISNDNLDKKENDNHFEKISSNLKKLGGTDNPTLNIFSDLLCENIDLIKSIIGSHKKYALKFTIDGIEPLYIDGVVNAINKIYISNISEENNGNLILNKSLLGFFKTDELGLSQSPNFRENESYKNLSLTIEDLISLIYSVKIHELFYPIIDKFMLNIIPYYDGITYSIIEKIINKEYHSNYKNIIKKTIDDIENGLCDINLELDESFSMMNIFNKSVKDLDYDDLNVTFDLIFKLKGGNTMIDLSTIKNYRFHKILLINKNISLLKKELFGSKNFDIKYIFSSFYKIHDKFNIDKFNNQIYNYIHKIIIGEYCYSYTNDYNFIEKSCYIMMNDDEPNSKINYLIKQYKFIKYMDKNARNEDMIKITSESYLLGEMIGKYCKTYQKDRKNLVKFVKLFSGHLKHKGRNIKDVFVFFDEFQSKLELNKCKFYTEDLIKINNMWKNFENIKFESFYFMRGYITAHHEYIIVDEKESEINSVSI